MDLIENELDEINRLLLHAEQDCQNSRNIFAKIKHKLISIKETYNQLLRDYQKLLESHNTINQLNANELIRKSQELAELASLLQNLQTELDTLNKNLATTRTKNSDFIRTTVRSHIGTLIQNFNCFKRLIENFRNDLNAKNNTKRNIVENILGYRNTFNRHVNDIRQRRNNLINLENRRSELFGNQQLYIQNYERYLRGWQAIISGQEPELNNLDTALNETLSRHAQHVNNNIQDEFRNLKDSIAPAARFDQTIHNSLNNCANSVRGSEQAIETINERCVDRRNNWNDNFIINFLFILLTVLYNF
ncbi:hypothetical protein BpHYR1_021397 [Brachionus plicatilis]|uniref:Uncharacterized protein n=1 Tax=Brachionus plicatilis TaxID=10195 RepID=A0A3M7PZC2_BRAPC|nr:hypothetical protein BpHYR1_021397 [Brachionus plicatilis]